MRCNWKCHTLLVGMQTVQILWITVCQFLRKLNRYLPHKPAILLLQIYPREIKTPIHKNLNINVCSSFIQHCQELETSSGEWINELLCWDPMEYSLAIKETNYWYTQHYERVSSAFLLGESGQVQKLHTAWFRFIPFWKRQNYRDKKQISDAQELGMEGGGDCIGEWELLGVIDLFCIIIVSVY